MVISDVIRPRSTIREDHIETPYRGTLCSSIVQFWQDLSEKKHFKDKSVKSLLWRHPVTWRHREYAQLIAHRQVLIGCTLKLSGLVSEIFSSKVATIIIRNHVISDVKRPGSTIREDHIYTVSQKNMSPYFCPYLRHIWADFKNSSTGTLCGKFAIKWLLIVPPHLNYVATLPGETLM